MLYLIDRLQSTGGGAEGIIQKLCHFLPADRFRCSVATFWARSDIYKYFPCPVYIFPLQRMYGWSALKYGLKLGSFLRSERVDIMHTFFAASDIWGGAVATLSGCPIRVSSRRDMGILRLGKHRVPYLFANHFFDQVQAVSERVREFCISQEHLAPEKVVTVANGVDLEAIDAAPSYDRNLTLGLDNATSLVITVANPRFVKGIDVLVRAIALVRRQLPNTKFVLIGEPQDESYMRELLTLVADLGVADNIRFLGPRGDVFSLLKMSDLFCLPSRSEGLSNALLEAMACSLPCVVTDVGGNSEVVVDGQSGFLVRSEQPESFAVRIVTLLRDRDLMKRMGQAGRRIVQLKFTAQHMVDRLVLLYDQLLQQQGLSSCIVGQRQIGSDRAKAMGRLSQE